MRLFRTFSVFYLSILILLANFVTLPVQANEVNNLFLLYESSNGVEIRKVAMQEGRTYTFDDPSLISYVPVFHAGSKSGDFSRKKDRIATQLQACAKNGQILLTLLKADGSTRRLPDINLEQARNLSIRVSVTGSHSYQAAFFIDGFQSISDDDGPVLDMFAGSIPIEAGDYSIFIEMLPLRKATHTISDGSVSYQMQNGWMVVTGHIQSGPPLTFVVDLGAASSVISAEHLPPNCLVHRFQMEEHSPDGVSLRNAVVAGATGMTENILGKTDISGLHLDGLSLPDSAFLVLDSFPEAITRHGIAGIIGMDILQQAGTVTFSRSDSQSSNGTLQFGSSAVSPESLPSNIPIHLANGHLYVPASLQGEPLRMILDTGSSVSHLSGSFIDSHDIRHDVIPSKKQQVASGLDGKGLAYKQIRVPGLVIGNEREQTVLFDVFKDSSSFDVLGTDSLLGMDYLLGFTTIQVDYDSETLKLWQ